MPRGVYVRTSEMKTGIHMVDKWNDPKYRNIPEKAKLIQDIEGVIKCEHLG